MNIAKSCPHWIPAHKNSAQDYPWFKRWNPRAIKLVINDQEVPTYMAEVAPFLAPDVVWILRSYEISENWGNRGFTSVLQAQEMARSHVAAYRGVVDKIVAQLGIARDRIYISTLNEPQEQAGGNEPPSFLRAYLITFLHESHKVNMRVSYGEWGVGHTDNHGETNAAPDWLQYSDVVAAALPTDVFSIHEYCPLTGMQSGWGWWGGSYLQIPFNVPIAITECGIDDSVVYQHKQVGWHSIPANSMAERALEYTNQLMWYEMRLQLDKRILFAFIFTHDIGSSAWDTFNTQNVDFMNAFLPRVSTTVAVQWGDSRTSRWHDLCDEFSAGQPFTPKLVGAMLAWENGGNILPFGQAGEVGLMQIFPKEKGASYSDRPSRNVLMNPRENIRTGVSFLRYCYDQSYILNGQSISNSLAHAVAAYNQGVGGLRTRTIYHASAQLYLSSVANTYKALWPGEPLPGDFAKYIGSVPPVPVPPPAADTKQKVTNGRWFCEEAARKLENALPAIAKALSALDPIMRSTQSPVMLEAMDTLLLASDEARAAHDQLTVNAIPVLYEAENSL